MKRFVAQQNNDPRIQKIFDLLIKFAKFDFHADLTISEKKDDLDTIIDKLLESFPTAWVSHAP